MTAVAEPEAKKADGKKGEKKAKGGEKAAEGADGSKAEKKPKAE